VVGVYPGRKRRIEAPWKSVMIALNLRSGFRVQGSGFRVLGAGFRIEGSGFRVQGAMFRVQGLGFRVRVQGSGFRVQGSGFRVQGLRVKGFEFWRLNLSDSSVLAPADAGS